MILITCPYCGPRNETEYHYGGQAHIPFPVAEDELTDHDWAEYLFYRDNTMGPYAERWMHAVGCRRWFNVVRDTISYDILATYRIGQPQPIVNTVETKR